MSKKKNAPWGTDRGSSFRFCGIAGRKYGGKCQSGIDLLQ